MSYHSDYHLRAVQLAQRIAERLGCDRCQPDGTPVAWAPATRREAQLYETLVRLWQLVEPSDDECAA